MSIRNYLTQHGINEERQSGLGTIKGHFFEINWPKTLWFNFKALPLKLALRVPILIAWNVKVRKVGKVAIEHLVTPGMISIGVIKITPWESNHDQIIFSNEGSITFGGRAKIHPGVRLAVMPNAELTLGERTMLGCRCRVICARRITLGHDVRLSWDSQLFDTDFHFLTNLQTGHTSRRQRDVEIGDEVFIGNRCTIGKGTHLPDGTIVSCCTKVTGDFSAAGPRPLIKGEPAQVVGTNYTITSGWYPEQEIPLAQQLEK